MPLPGYLSLPQVARGIRYTSQDKHARAHFFGTLRHLCASPEHVYAHAYLLKLFCYVQSKGGWSRELG